VTYFSAGLGLGVTADLYNKYLAKPFKAASSHAGGRRSHNPLNGQSDEAHLKIFPINLCLFPIRTLVTMPSFRTGASSIYSAGYTEMTLVCLPDPLEDEALLRLLACHTVGALKAWFHHDDCSSPPGCHSDFEPSPTRLT
jgi:hypothetical protein